MAIKTRRVLMIGGIMDGKWHTHEGGGHTIRIMKPMDLKLAEVMKADEADLNVPLPQYEEYWLDHVALYGVGLWVGMHKDTHERMDMEGWRRTVSAETRTVMILRAILQRDVATEMGL